MTGKIQDLKAGHINCTRLVRNVDVQCMQLWQQRNCSALRKWHSKRLCQNSRYSLLFLQARQVIYFVGL